MEEALASWSGDWEGKSTSRNNDPTFWKDAHLSFILTPGTTVGSVEGSGLSLWRNLQIEFDVHGHFNWDTKEVRGRFAAGQGVCVCVWWWWGVVSPMFCLKKRVRVDGGTCCLFM